MRRSLLSFLFLFWNRVALHCCVSFCYVAKWISYTCVCISIYSYFVQSLSHVRLCSVAQSCPTQSVQPHGLQHARLPCPSPFPRVCANSCLLSRWCHPTISSLVTPFSSCPQSFPAWGYIYTLFFFFFFFWSPSHLDHHRALSSSFPGLFSRFSLVIYFIHRSVYMLIPISKFIPRLVSGWPTLLSGASWRALTFWI